MINRDYHHHRLDEALADAERLIGSIRINNKAEQTRFITGFGVIRTELFNLLENYGLEPTYELSNPGAILVVIE
jgi:hypothetical protein